MFLRQILRRHPCRLGWDSIKRLRFDGEGQRFVLSLPDSWFVTYRVIPDCEASSGTVEFIDVRHFSTDFGS